MHATSRPASSSPAPLARAPTDRQTLRAVATPAGECCPSRRAATTSESHRNRGRQTARGNHHLAACPSANATRSRQISARPDFQNRPDQSGPAARVTTGDARDRLDRELAIVRRLTAVPDLLWIEIQLLADVVHKPVGAAQRARQVITHLNDMLADRVIVIQRIEIPRPSARVLARRRPSRRPHARPRRCNNHTLFAQCTAGVNRRALVGIFVQ